jgi:hypothetical protein
MGLLQRTFFPLSADLDPLTDALVKTQFDIQHRDTNGRFVYCWLSGVPRAFRLT